MFQGYQYDQKLVSSSWYYSRVCLRAGAPSLPAAARRRSASNNWHSTFIVQFDPQFVRRIGHEA